MTNKQIQLSKKIVIRTQDEIETYKVNDVFSEYFGEYNYQLESLSVAKGYQVANPEAIINRLEGMYAARFGAKIAQSAPFCDFYGYRFKILGVGVVPAAFTREMENPALTIYLITEPMELLESFGATLVMKYPVVPNTFNRVLTVELNDLTLIYSLS